MLNTVFRSLWKNFVNLVYTLTCLICKVRLTPLSDKPLCTACWQGIDFNLSPFCRVCGKHLPACPVDNQADEPATGRAQAFICKDCQRSAYFFSKAHSVCIYDGIIKECIHLFKYKAKLSLAQPLSKLMVDFAGNFLNMQNIDLILPVPLHGSKLRSRQFNQAALLAKGLAEAFSKQVQDKLLIKIHSGPAQVNLSRTKRLENVQGSFKVKDIGPLKDRNILLVDDVLTTAATANECAKTLLEAGAQRVDVFTLARSN